LAPLLAALLVSALTESPCVRARAAYDALQLEQALTLVDRGIVEDPEHVAVCLEARSLTLLVLGRTEEARRALDALFAAYPSHELRDPSLSPAQSAELAAARERRRPPRLDARAAWLDAERIALELRVERLPPNVAQLRLLQVAPLAATLERLRPNARGVVTATVAAPLDEGRAPPRLDVVVALEDLRGEPHGTLAASPDLPPRPARLESSGVAWYWWVGGALALVGGGVAAAVLAQPKPPAGVGLGRVDVDP
jgi:hypothetical protein